MFISMIMKYGCSKRCSTFGEKRKIDAGWNGWSGVEESKCLAQYVLRRSQLVGIRHIGAHTHGQRDSSMVHLTYNSQFERASNLINLFRVKRNWGIATAVAVAAEWMKVESCQQIGWDLNATVVWAKTSCGRVLGCQQWWPVDDNSNGMVWIEDGKTPI